MSGIPIAAGQYQQPAPDFRSELAAVINKYSRENGSNTPDFILAEFLERCLIAFDKTVNVRETWYGRYAMPAKTPEH